MDTLDRDLDQWLDKSPSEEDIREVLEVLKKKKEETFKQLEQIRDYEKDEVVALQDRLMLLRGGEKQTKTTDSSVCDSPVQKASRSLHLVRSMIVENCGTRENGSVVLNRSTSEHLMDIVKIVYAFVSEEQQGQLEKITDLLDVDKQEKDNIMNLQRTLGYDITKVLLERFLVEKPYSAKEFLRLIRDKDGQNDEIIRNYIGACFKLVWLMLMETPPLVFYWDISKSHYRYPAGQRGHFHPNDRIIDPAIAIKQKTGQMENRIKGILQSTSE